MLLHIKFSSPASRTALEHVPMVEQAIKHGGMAACHLADEPDLSCSLLDSGNAD